MYERFGEKISFNQTIQFACRKLLKEWGCVISERLDLGPKG